MAVNTSVLIGCIFSSVQFSLSAVSDSLQPHGLQHARLSCPSNSWSLHKRTSIESMMPSNHLILCRPLLLLPSVFPSIRVFSNESVLLIRWPKYWSFSFNISPSNEYSGLISFTIDWFDLLAVQGVLKSLLQHCSSKASILRHSASFIFKISFIYLFFQKAERKGEGGLSVALGQQPKVAGVVYCTRHKRSTLAEPPEP